MSALDASVTLEDVFTVVEAKRVPLAPELAGYLTLEIADGTDAGSGDVDPKTVFISEEGTVALVYRRREWITGDAEASVRMLLSKLLDASGSGTPALTAAAKRAPGNGLPALVEELEAALIPVNRAAGRRALARLAREVKRVLLGVGRNASVPPVQSRPPVRLPAAHARPVLRKRDEDRPSASARGPKRLPHEDAPLPRLSSFSDEAVTRKQTSQLTQLRSGGSDDATAAPAHENGEKVELGMNLSVAEARHEVPGPTLLRNDDVESLVGSFGVSGPHEDKQIARELKAIAGLSPTPPPPDTITLAELTKDVGKDLPNKRALGIDGDSVEALLALTDSSGPIPGALSAEKHAPSAVPVTDPSSSLPPSPIAGATGPRASAPVAPAPLGRAESATRERPRAPKTSLALLVLALLVLAGGTVATWKFRPQIFTGKKRATTSGSTLAPPVAPPKCKIALVLTDVPVNAEILLRVGQAPVDVERMPVGTRLEFIATAEGYAPRRAVVKGESTWDNGPDGKPRIDVPIQLDPSKAKPGTVEPWPAAEPGSHVGGAGAPGTVHVVSNVRGAEVWLLAGVGPEARIDQLGCDGDIDVLFAGPPALRRRLHISEKHIAETPADPTGNRIVHIRGETVN